MEWFSLEVSPKETKKGPLEKHPPPLAVPSRPVPVVFRLFQAFLGFSRLFFFFRVSCGFPSNPLKVSSFQPEIRRSFSKPGLLPPSCRCPPRCSPRPLWERRIERLAVVGVEWTWAARPLLFFVYGRSPKNDVVSCWCLVVSQNGQLRKKTDPTYGTGGPKMDTEAEPFLWFPLTQRGVPSLKTKKQTWIGGTTLLWCQHKGKLG